MFFLKQLNVKEVFIPDFYPTDMGSVTRRFDNYLWPIQLKSSYICLKTISKARSLGLSRVIGSDGCSAGFISSPTDIGAVAPQLLLTGMPSKPVAFLIQGTSPEFHHTRTWKWTRHILKHLSFLLQPYGSWHLTSDIWTLYTSAL